MSTANLTLENLGNFTGSDRSFYNPLFRKFSYTTGVKFVSDNGASWLIIDILAHLIHNKKVNREEFVCVTLKVNKDRTACLTLDDGNDIILDQQIYPMTDFPLSTVKFFATNNMLMLASEY
jgi:hypothetical protein